MPKVSVILPVYNVAPFVGDALNSLLRQTLTDIQILAINDGSTDGSGAVLDDMASRDDRVVVLHQDNAGLGAARNAGLAAAEGDWIAFLDGDDMMRPDALASLLAAAEETGCDWAAGDASLLFPDGSEVPRPLGPDGQPDGSVERHALDDWQRIIGHAPSAWNKIYRRDLFDAVRFDDGWFEDHTAFLSIADRTDAIAHLARSVIWHRRDRQGQITSADDDRAFQHFDVMDRIGAILRASSKPGAKAAQDTLESRLLDERLVALKSHERRQRFKTMARARFAAQPVELSPLMKGALGPDPVLTIAIFADAPHKRVLATLASLEAQAFREIEVLFLNAGDAVTESEVLTLRSLDSRSTARQDLMNTALEVATGTYLTFLTAGDVLQDWVTHHWCDVMLRHDADFAVAAFKPWWERKLRTGFLPEASVPNPLTPFAPPEDFEKDLAPDTAGKVFRRAPLVARNIRFVPPDLLEWNTLKWTMLAARSVVFIPTHGARLARQPLAYLFPDANAVPKIKRARDLMAEIDQIVRSQGKVDKIYRSAFAASAIWHQAAFAKHPSVGARRRFAVAAALAARRKYGRAKALPPHIQGLIRTVMCWPELGKKRR